MSVKVIGLGAIHGFIVGLALEKARITFENYQITQAARESAQVYARTGHWGDIFYEAGWELQVPLLSIVVFAVVAYLINKWFVESDDRGQACDVAILVNNLNDFPLRQSNSL